MKKYLPLVALAGLLSAMPASAQIWVGDFLERYRASQTGLQALTTLEAPPASLTQMAQDGGVPLRVDDVIRLALENNLNVGINRLSPIIAEYAINAAYQQFDPTLTLSANVNRSSTPAITQLDGADVRTQLQGSYAATYSHRLSPGASYQVRFGLNRTSSNSAFNTVNPSYSGTLTYSFSQPLLRNFGSRINRAPIVIAQNNLEISQIQFQSQIMDTVAQATNLYWDLVGARENIRVQQASLELANRTLADNRRQVEIGTLAPIEVVQAEQEVASRQVALISAQYNRQRIEDSIKQMITRVPDPAMVLLALNPVEDVQNRTDAILPVEDAIRLALLNRPELRQAEIEIRSNELQVAVAKNSLRPAFDLNASYTQSGIGGIQRPVGQPPILGGMSDAFGQVFGFDFTGYAVGFSLQIPLSNKSAKANYERTVTQQRLAESRYAATAQQIATSVRDAFNQIEMNRAQIQAARTARELAERRLDAEQRKFTLGASAIRFVLQEQQNLTQAQTSEIQAQVNYVKAIVAYDRAIGRTLETNNIQIQPQVQPALASISVDGVTALPE